MEFDPITSAIMTKTVEFGPIVLSLLTVALLVIVLVSHRDLARKAKALIITSIIASGLVAVIAFFSLFVIRLG